MTFKKFIGLAGDTDAVIVKLSPDGSELLGVATLGGPGPDAAYEIDAAYRLAEYLREADRLGPTLDLEERMEVGQLVQQFPEDWHASDAALEAYVLAAAPEEDARLVALLHRKTLRQEALLRPVLRELRDVSIQLLPRDTGE